MGLHPCAVTKPGDHVELGTEVMPSPGVRLQNIILDRALCVIMPSHRAEIVTIDQRQFYKLPATHRNGSPVYLIAPIETGNPEASLSIVE